MNRIRKNDQVVVLAGRDRGKQGKVLEVQPDQDRALVEGINQVKHYTRRTQQNQQGGIIAQPAPIYLAKLALWCPRCGRGVRVGFTTLQDGSKVRTCRRCHETLG